jgi:putative two-component system response regulator
MTVRYKILIIDDSPISQETLMALLDNELYDLYFSANGVDGYAIASSIRPDVILLDVMMPGMNGYDVCRMIRADSALAEVPILFITSLDDRDSRLEGLRAGADDFISKPFDSLELLARLQTITRLNRYSHIVEQKNELERLHNELSVAYDKTIQGWSRALDLRDKETEGHTLRVTEKTLRLARLIGVKESEMKHILHGSLLHDVGKLGIPDSILLKPGSLSAEEWDIMRQHPEYAFEWLSEIDYLGDALSIPYCHHEKWDGTGYPRGLKGENIPLFARIFALADVWDAITSERPYRRPMSPQEAMSFISSQSGSHFDPAIVPIFLEMIKKDLGEK